MKERILLQLIEGRLVLSSLIECEQLRIPKRFVKFVIDTGSANSYLSDREIKILQVPIRDRECLGEVDIGGSRFKQVNLPKIKMYLLKEDESKHDYIELQVSLSALKTTKSSKKKIQTAQALPSILGMDFLKEQKMSLHVIPAEDMAFLEY
jgi:hypothetical protein